MVQGHSRWTVWSLWAVLALAMSDSTFAVPPSDAILPDTARGYVSVPDVNRLRGHWKETQLGQLMQDPAMAPFVEDMKRQLQEKATRLHETLGLTLADMSEVAGGEMSVALVEPVRGRVALVVLIDVTGHGDQARALLAKMYGRLTEQKAKKETRAIGSVELVVWTLAPRAKQSRPREAAFFLHADMLCGSDDCGVAEAVLRRLSDPGKGSLAEQPAYRAIMARCQPDADLPDADLRWFLDPFGYSEAVRAASPPSATKKGKDLLKILAAQGFTAIQGIGGCIHLYVDGKCELLHRTAIHAPPVAGKESDAEKYELAARMLQFPNGGALAPDHWVPRGVALYASLNWEIRQAFDASETLVDALVGKEGTFEEILEGLRLDEIGPQIDLRSELIGHLGRRATVITDYELPITPQSERWLLAVETTDASKLSQTIDQTMKSDPNAKRHEFNGHVVWEITDEEPELPELTIESPAFDPLFATADEEDAPEEDRSLPNSAVCVAFGQLLIASHFDFLVKVLMEVSERETLARSVDYQLVMDEVEKVGPGEACIRFFSRTDEDYRPTYELIRAGRMPEAESLLGRLLNQLLGEGDEDVLRPQRIDGSKLPDFEMVRRYLGPAGLTVKNEKNGWFATGLLLNKEAPGGDPYVADRSASEDR